MKSLLLLLLLLPTICKSQLLTAHDKHYQYAVMRFDTIGRWLLVTDGDVNHYWNSAGIVYGYDVIVIQKSNQFDSYTYKHVCYLDLNKQPLRYYVWMRMPNPDESHWVSPTIIPPDGSMVDTLSHYMWDNRMILNGGILTLDSSISFGRVQIKKTPKKKK